MRKLGLDLGSKSCGIAISDPLNITAQGLENFIFEEYNFELLIEKLISIFGYYKIDTIVVGIPTYPSGDKTKTATMIDDEILPLIEKNFPECRIVKLNENNTTKKAREIMHEAGLNTKKQKKFKDKIAAQLILDDFLQTLI